ncbi:EC30 protein [Colletotrichum tofieldiae]|nr:EC30 protein [Colletotrichum tofieldiae]
MKFLAFSPVLSLTSLVAALPTPETQEVSLFKYPWLNMTLSNLKSVCRREEGKNLYTCTLEFDLYDPNTEGVVEVNGAHCGAAWEWDGITPEHGSNNNYPSTGVLCWSGGSNAFQFRVAEFRSASRFELYVSHLYRDTR